MTATYNAPEKIPLGTDTDFRLYLNAATGSADFTGAPGAPITRTGLPSARFVRAVMVGPQTVSIDPRGAPACQVVAPGTTPEWDWYVTPKALGRFDLGVNLWEVSDCTQNATGWNRHLDSFHISVTATWQDYVKIWLSTTQGFLTAVLALIGAAGAAFGAWKWAGKGKT